MGDDVGRMTSAELQERLGRAPRLVVLDVREDSERTFCAIPLPPTAADLHIPMGAVADRLGAIRAAADGIPLVVYCHHGVRSMAVARWLARQGVADVHNLEGGIDAWSLGVDPGVRRY